MLIREPLGNAMPKVLATLVGVQNDLRWVLLRPSSMRFAVIFDRLTFTVLDAAGYANAPATSRVTADRVVCCPLVSVAAIATKLPNGFTGDFRHPHSPHGYEVTEALSLNIDPSVSLVSRALLRTKHLPAL